VLGRAQVLAHRRAAGALDERLLPGPGSRHRAAWAGLQDSMPRAALLSIHARVEGASPASWQDPPLVQVWGLRYSAYVVAEADVALFTLARLPETGARRRVAEDTAARLRAFLGDRRMAYADAGHAMGVDPNALRYATLTGTVRIHWDGARRPDIWVVPPPAMDPHEALLELARRYLHVQGPGTAGAFGDWAGIKPQRAEAAFAALAHELVAVRTPIGDSWALASDESALRSAHAGSQAPAVRLLPSGDAYTLLAGVERELLVPDAERRSQLWTPRVWPGAVLVDGEIVGTWRRSQADVTVSPWGRLPPGVRERVELEAATLPLPDLTRAIGVRWDG
jgi:hypothetical protein